MFLFNIVSEQCVTNIQKHLNIHIFDDEYVHLSNIWYILGPHIYSNIHSVISFYWMPPSTHIYIYIFNFFKFILLLLSIFLYTHRDPPCVAYPLFAGKCHFLETHSLPIYFHNHSLTATQKNFKKIRLFMAHYC